MKRKTFLLFAAPSLASMALLIALPLLFVLWQSFFVTTEVMETRLRESCDPFGCTTQEVLQPARDEAGNIIRQTTFSGWENYRVLLRPAEAAAALARGDWAGVLNIDFYRALRFTLVFTFVTLPLILILGLALALAVNRALRQIRGPVIFVSLLPLIITPVIGALSIKWLFIGDGILTALLEKLLERDLALFAQAWTIEILMMFYRVWHVAPFAFVIFYAGLQTVNRDELEAALIDGASRWQRLIHIIIPHLMPLVIFVALIHLMDAYRAFDEVVGFSSQAHVISLQWLTFDLLQPDDSGNRAISRASASAVLTMVGIVLLLVPVLRRTRRDYGGGQ